MALLMSISTFHSRTFRELLFLIIPPLKIHFVASTARLQTETDTLIGISMDHSAYPSIASVVETSQLIKMLNDSRVHPTADILTPILPYNQDKIKGTYSTSGILQRSQK